MKSEAVNYNEFRNFITEQTNSLRSSCENLKKDIVISSEIPEDLIGELNVATGQSELLIKERFTQFASLIDDSEFKRSEKEITLVDLQGFWDIVMIQVEKIKQKIEYLNNIKKNNWHRDDEKNTIVKKSENVKKVSKVVKSKNIPTAGKAKIRSHILALRKEMKMKNKPSSEIIIATSEKDKENISVNVIPPSDHKSGDDGSCLKEFDAGFFSVYSPIRSPEKSKNTPIATQSSSKNKKKRLLTTPANRKDYSPCARVTRSMKKNLEMNKDFKLTL